MKPTNQQLARQVIGLLDLTSLNSNDTAETIVGLCQRAVTPYGHVAAVCVYPRFVSLARRTLQLLGAPQVRVATVINFPYGGPNISAAASQARAAVAAGADEIDVVYPYRTLLMGDRDTGIALIAACREVCNGRDVILKAILESGELRDPQVVREASQDAIAAGAHFLKTSTGKVLVNATEQGARIMLEAIAERGGSVGFKAAGGIRTLEDARAYVELAGARFGRDWIRPERFRLGASALLDELLACLMWGGEG